MNIDIDADQPRTPVSPNLYGIFFEEINHAGEGGLCAELVQNRDFEVNALPAGTRWAGNLLETPQGWCERRWFSNELHGWTLVADDGAAGSIRQVADQPMDERNPHSMRLHAVRIGRRVGVANSGFWGMNIQDGQDYNLLIHARTGNAESHNITVALESSVGHRTYASSVVAGVAGPWTAYRCTLHAVGSDPQARLTLCLDRPGTVWFDFVSLTPRHTFGSRPNGMRLDLARMLKELRPAFLRFPGGCVVEGMTLSNRFQWKDSIGDVSRRRGTVSLWGYYNTYALGFHEFLQFAEDINAAAMYVVNVGMSCQFRRGEVCPESELPNYVQDTLNALEYAMGPADSPWGARRAANGRIEPFRIPYVEIGNENYGDEYVRRYQAFRAAIKAKYPDITIIANRSEIVSTAVEVEDHHYYRGPDWFFENVGIYDATDRSGPRVYVGEYACNQGVGQGNLLAALAEAAFMLGIERNGDLVTMASYAPLLFNINDIAWPVNLIGFDSARVFGRTSYYVQKLFAQNRPDEVLATRVDDVREPTLRHIFALAGIDRSAGELVVKIVSRAPKAQTVSIRIAGVALKANAGRTFTLACNDPTEENSIHEPELIVPVESTCPVRWPRFDYTLPPYSLSVLRIPCNTGAQ